jgi:hypothetical protein
VKPISLSLLLLLLFDPEICEFQTQIHLQQKGDVPGKGTLGVCTYTTLVKFEMNYQITLVKAEF